MYPEIFSCASDSAPRRSLGRSRRLAAVAMLSFALFLFGCGSGSGNGGSGSNGSGLSGGPPGGTGGTALTSAQIVATISSAQSQFQNMIAAGADVPTRDAQLVTFLKNQTTIADAGQDKDGCVWARFTNGRYYMLLDNRAPFAAQSVPGDFGQPIAHANAVRSARPKVAAESHRTASAFVRRAAGDRLIPQSKQARLIRALDTATFGDAVPVLQDMLQRRGYQVVVQEGSVENLRSIQNDGIFYIDTHGGIGGGKARFWDLWTTTPISEQNEKLYESDLADGSLIYLSAVDGTGTDGKYLLKSHYGLTVNFVKKYHWGFAQDSFVYLNCCYGSDPATGPVLDLRKLAEPAGSTYGWSAPIAQKSVPVAYYVFDRLLGTNNITPNVDMLRRPFDSEAIYTTLAASNWNQETYTAADKSTQTSYFLQNGPDFILTPNIRTMTMQERIAEAPLQGKTQLTLHGQFGATQGTVKIGGTEVPVLSWKPDTVVCQPAEKPGAGFSGDVEVSIDDHDSNAVALTQWHGTLTYDIDLLPPQAASAHAQITVDAYLRADLHDFRDYPEQALQKQAPVAFRVSQGSSAHWQVSGAPVPASSWVSPTSADLPFGLHAAPSPFGTGYILSGTIDPKTKKVALSFSYLGCGISYQIDGGPGGGTVLTLHDPLLTSTASGIDQTDGYPIYANNITAAIGDDDLIPAFTLNGSTPILSPVLKLTDFIPSAAPIPANGEDQDPH